MISLGGVGIGPLSVEIEGDKALNFATPSSSAFSAVLYYEEKSDYDLHRGVHTHTVRK